MIESQAKKIDQILNLLVERDIQYPGNTTSAGDANHKLDIPEEEANHLINIIVDEIEFNGDQIVKHHESMFGKKILVNYNTKLFMDAGGCMDLYYDISQIQKEDESRTFMEDIKLRNDLESFRITKKQYGFTKWTAIFSFAIAFISIFLQLYLEFWR
ncbi:MAG: hypothetical protein HQ522_16655 [Bacteroidetes bacterium]|nr:hypothetical protein [Bacteroidota bacterium]